MMVPTRLGAELGDCANEPIHIPGAIQPHGVLVAAHLPDWDISHHSANLSDLLPERADEVLLGAPLEALTGGQVLHDLRNALQNAMVIKGAERVYDIRIPGCAARLDALVHALGDRVMLELLPHEPNEIGSPMTVARGMIARLDRATTLERYCQLAATQLRAVTGFDRVMIYKFMPDDSGQVVAEAARSGVEPYLGLRYPASDIPAQARAMFLKQWLRLIPDATYRPVPLLAADPAAPPLDLGLSALRSVSPVHLEYLANMGVAASMTVSIVVRGRLWGLMACHHFAPRLPSAVTCATVELFAQIFSLQVESKQREDEQAYLDRARAAHHRLIANMSRHRPIAEALAEQGPVLMEAIPSDGVGIWIGGRFAGSGIVPPLGSIAGLVAYVDSIAKGRAYATDCLSAEYPPAAAYVGEVSGLLATPISRSPADYLLFFRREMVQTVNWGGDPSKSVQRQRDGSVRVSPRKSFSAWKETVRSQSLPWRDDELTIAEALRVALLEMILMRADVEERERREANERQALLIAELNHRVKNILALIGSLMRQSVGGARSVEDFTSDLEARIRTLAVAHEQLTASGWSKGPFRALLLTEFEPWLGPGMDGRVDLHGPDVMLETRAYQAMALVFHELVTNAAKYGALSNERGRVVLKWELEPTGSLTVVWRELGGPRVEKPTRRGFGSTIIERAVPFELQGEAILRHLPEGLCAEFRVPADFILEGEVPVPEVVLPAPPMHRIDGVNLLLVEDSMMIALDAEAMLREAGARNVEVAGTVRDAMRVLTLNEIDAAILDLNLHSETSHAVGDYLMERGMPFAFATGYGDGLAVPERFAGVPVIAKPYDRAALQAVLGDLLYEARRRSGRSEAE